MNKHLKITVCIVMATAFTLIGCCVLNYINLGEELHSFEARLSESRNTWESIAAEKEKLQDELKAKQKELNIARLELDSATADAVKIRTEIENLKSEIEALKMNQ